MRAHQECKALGKSFPRSGQNPLASPAGLGNRREAHMRKGKHTFLALAIVAASFVPAANAFAGLNLANHSETLLED